MRRALQDLRWLWRRDPATIVVLAAIVVVLVLIVGTVV